MAQIAHLGSQCQGRVVGIRCRTQVEVNLQHWPCVIGVDCSFWLAASLLGYLFRLANIRSFVIPPPDDLTNEAC